ncbi:hypothetical protein OK016_28890 [Vibrio chagasii]|nr:hypothetical protein [Vibrio chagasii]
MSFQCTLKTLRHACITNRWTFCSKPCDGCFIALASVLIALLIGLNIAKGIRKPSKLLQRAITPVTAFGMMVTSLNNEFGSASDKVNLVISHPTQND